LQRFKLMPELPTLDEVGIEGYDASNWYAFAVPAGTPKPVADKLYKSLADYFTSSAMQKKLASMGIVVDIKTSADMRKIVPEEIAKWKQIAIDTGMPRFNK
jgi:tripartite-type tricarboxylate transporter receptor subunit TctC